MCEPYQITGGQFVEFVPNLQNLKTSEEKKKEKTLQMNPFGRRFDMCYTHWLTEMSTPRLSSFQQEIEILGVQFL